MKVKQYTIPKDLNLINQLQTFEITQFKKLTVKYYIELQRYSKTNKPKELPTPTEIPNVKVWDFKFGYL